MTSLTVKSLKDGKVIPVEFPEEAKFDFPRSGTFPIQSRRMFHALRGHGATVRLVMPPHESHGYRAEESVFHVLVEMFEWFDKYVKNK